MNWLVRCLSSSVGKKFVLGITGLLLCGFLVVHLAGNLFLFAGADAYNGYADKLHSLGGLLLAAEIGLLLLFLAHLTLAFVTTRQNRIARQQRYAVKQTKQDGPLLTFEPHSWMFVTGAIVLGFILVHLSDFRFGELEPGEAQFDKAVRILKNPTTVAIYVVGSLVLGLHLSHGFASAFQSLGANHPKYNGFISCLGKLFAVVIAIGFASLPLWAIMFQH